MDGSLNTNNMKAEFLKLAGVKTEKAFYKKYPTEAAFFKAHPEAKKMIKKAQVGVDLDGNGIDDNQDRINKIKQLANPLNTSAAAPNIFVYGPQEKPKEKPQDLNAPTNSSTGFGFKQPSIPMEDYTSKGSNIVTISDEELKNPKSGMTNPELLPNKKGGDDFWTKASPYAGYAGQLIGGIQNLEAEKKARKSAEQWANVSGVVAKAAGLRPELRERRYVRPEDNILQPDQMFPSYGVGTNVLARDGAEIQNTYAPGYLYDDLGYEPLDDSDQLKQYMRGGEIPTAQLGTATRADSLAVLNSQLALNKFYDNEVKAGRLRKNKSNYSVEVSEKDLSELNKDNLNFYRKEIKRRKEKHQVDDEYYKKHFKLTPNQVKKLEEQGLVKTKSGNKHKQYYRDDITPMQNLAAPFALIDSRIGAQGKVDYKAFNNDYPGGSVTVYDYDPLAVTPFDILKKKNPELIAERIKKYGNSGIPKSYLNEINKNKNENKDKRTTQESINLTPFGLANLTNDSGSVEELKIRKEARMPKSFDVSLQRGTMPGPSEYYNYDNPNATIDQMLAAKRASEAYNAKLIEKYGNSKNPKAKERLEKLKQDFVATPNYNLGGNIPQAQTGFETFMTGGGGQMLTGLADYGTGNNAGGQIGGAIGGAAGMAIGGPAGAMVGQTLGTLAGGMLDPNARKQKKAQEKMMRNINSATMSQGAMQLQNQFSGFMEHGGQITNPQVIAKFGEYSMDDLLAPPHDADMLRAGGHLSKYTPVSQRGLSTMEEGGDLQTHWGGYAEPISQNPYLPANGETVMFRGQSHDESDGQGNTGIGITYGDAPVEVERGEPAIELQEPNGDTNLTVFGNLKIPNAYIPILGDEKAKGKKFKNYVAELSKQEKKQNSIIEKSTSILDALELGTSFDKLKLASLQANIQGANMKLKEIADRKMNAASLQSAINDTAEEYGLDADALAKGKAKMDPNAFEEYAKKGKTVTKETTTPVKTTRKVKMKALDHIPKGQHRNEATGTWGRVTMKDVARMMMNNKWYDGWDDFDPSSEKDVEAFQIAFNKKAKENGSDAYIHVDGDLGEQTVSARFDEQVNTESGKNTTTTTKESKDKNYEVVPYKKNALVDIYNQILPFIRPTDQEALDPMQLAGEMYALSTNQLEPVQAQTFQPELGVPYDISLQDQLNANQADYRAAQRMVGYNPAAQAMLNAQKYEANSKVLGDQFRANQAMKDQVYGANRNILNDAKLKNLEIYDKQYQRQAEALSNTKATTQAALNSIASKYAQNKLENRTLGVYENMYNYRFDPSGRAVNMNPLFQPNMPYMYGPDGEITHVATYDDKGSIKGYIPISEEEEDVTDVQYSTPDDDYDTTTTTDQVTQRKGGKTKKNYSQSSIVRAFK